MTKSISVLFTVLMIAVQARGYEPVTLQQVLSRAAAKVEAGDTAVALARSRLQLLESMNRRRFQFRPQFGLLSFSNPMVLATSIGGGLSYGKSGAPTPFDIQNARLDVLVAEVALERAKVQAQVEASGRFFDLLEKQQVSAWACGADQEAYTRFSSVRKGVAERRLTVLDQVRFEEGEQEVKAACVEAESRRKISAVVVGAVLESSGESSNLRAVDLDELKAVARRPMPALQNLLVLAMSSRKEPRRLRSEIAALQKQTRGSSPMLPSSVSIGYRNLRASDAGTVTRSQFLQGHSIIPEAAWDFSRRSRSEQEMRQEILALRARAFENELAGIEQEIRFALEKAHVLTATHREKLELAQKRLELSRRAEMLVKVRFDHGFEGPEVVFQAEGKATRAQAEVARVQHEINAGLVSLFALCGGEPESLPQLPRTFELALSGGN